MQNMLLVRLCADACGAVADHDAFCAEGKIVHATHSDSTGIYVDGLRSMLDALQLRLLERGKRFNKLGRQKRVHLRETWSGERSAELASTSETRNPKPTLKTYLPQDRSKPETRNRLLKLVSNCKTRNPKPTAKVGFNRRNPKPETDSESWFQATKPETETRNRLLKLVSNCKTQNPKPETDSESGFQSTKPETETRNPKPTAKVGFNRQNTKPKPETDSNPTFGWLSGSELICVPILFTLLHPLVFTHTDTNCIFWTLLS